MDQMEESKLLSSSLFHYTSALPLHWKHITVGTGSTLHWKHIHAKRATGCALARAPCAAKCMQVACSLHAHVLHHNGSIRQSLSQAQREARSRAAPCLSCRRGRCREGRQAPALRAELLQAGEHLVGAPRLRRVQLRVRHHDDRPARIAGPRVSSKAAGSMCTGRFPASHLPVHSPPHRTRRHSGHSMRL